MKLSDVKEGMILVADGGFTCLSKGERCEVFVDDSGRLYIVCDRSRHYLDGQSNDNGELIGLVEAAK